LRRGAGAPACDRGGGGACAKEKASHQAFLFLQAKAPRFEKQAIEDQIPARQGLRMNNVLRGAIAAAEAEGERLREEFYRPDGPRGRRGSAPVDTEMEERLRAALQALVPCAFLGEETGFSKAVGAGQEPWLWLVDPHGGTSEFLQGRRG